jgi:hypothetical protein
MVLEWKGMKSVAVVLALLAAAAPAAAHDSGGSNAVRGAGAFPVHAARPISLPGSVWEPQRRRTVAPRVEPYEVNCPAAIYEENGPFLMQLGGNPACGSLLIGPRDGILRSLPLRISDFGLTRLVLTTNEF